MVFKKASSVATIDKGSEKMNLTAKFEELDTQFQGVVTDSQPIPDSFLPADVQAALAAVAELVGFADYNSEVCTLFMSVRDGDKRMYGPSLKAHEGSAAIVWGKHVIPLDATENLRSSKYSITATEYGGQILVDASGYCMPIGISFESQWVKKDAFASFRHKMLTLGTAEEISGYLNRSEEIIKWADVEDGATVEFHTLTAVYDREDAAKIKYFMALAVLNGSACRMYAPGDVAQWEGVEIGDDPLLLTKNGKIITSSTGTTYEMKGGFRYSKLSELQPGIEYKVIGFSVETGGKYGDKVLLDVMSGTELLKVNGNTLINKRLMPAGRAVDSSAITEANPATLIVDSIVPTKDGKSKANCRLTLAADNESPMLQKLRQQQAELAAKKTAAVPNPF
jgi:hypothetical protein